MPASTSARLFIFVIVFAGFSLFANAIADAGSDNHLRFISFLVVTCIAARLRLKLPGVTGTMSMNLPFILIALAQMNTAEVLVVSCLSTLVQCVARAGKRFNWVQAMFNFANMALAVEFARWLYSSARLNAGIHSHPLLLGVAAAGFFAVNTVPVAIIIALTEDKNVLRAWVTMFQLSYPYFLAGAGVAGVALTVSARLGWQVPLLVLPLMLGVFYSYRRYFMAAALTHPELKRGPQSASVTTTQAVS